MLCMPSTTIDGQVTIGSDQFSIKNADLDMDRQTSSLKAKMERGFSIHELEPHTLGSLHALVSLVHDRVNLSQPVSNSSTEKVGSGEEDEVKPTVVSNLFSLEEDPIANIVWTLEPHTFQDIFLAMAHNFPRTLEAYILHALSPVGVEVLTRKFERMDQMLSAEDREKFYQKFYGVLDNQFCAMDALLNGKEAFAHKAFNNVLVQYLGVEVDDPQITQTASELE